MPINSWLDFCEIVNERSDHLPSVYKKRIKFELDEINKQGIGSTWIEYYNLNSKFDSNPNNLLVPWAMGMLLDNTDPMSNRRSKILLTSDYTRVNEYKETHGDIPHDFIKDYDVPDIDIDCLPESRDKIKEYAEAKYSNSVNLDDLQVCSVGTWTTYKFKMALQDSIVSLGLMERKQIEKITSELPEDLDGLKPGGYGKCKGKILDEMGESKECGTKHRFIKCPNCGSEITDSPTLEKLISEFESLKDLFKKYPEAVDYAARMVGRIRSMGMHAGAMIISNNKLLGKVPLGKNKEGGQWVSLWSEGSNQQLSKCGYCKFDVLGLKTLGYIHSSSMAITKNRGIKFGKPQLKYSIKLKDGTSQILQYGEMVNTKDGPKPIQDIYQNFIDYII